MVGDEGNQGEVAGALDGEAQGPLVLGADSGAAARLDFGPVGDEPPDFVDVFVVDEFDVFDAEGADAAAGDEPPAGASAGASARPAATAGASAGAAAGGAVGRGRGG